MADWIEVGKKAPAFTLTADDGRKVKLSDLKGSPVVLYFYPRDDTPGCTKEACAFRDRKADLEKLGAKVLGVSPDTVESHVKFRDKFQPEFPAAGRSGPRRGREVRGLAGKEHVRQEEHGRPAFDVPD